MTDDQYRDALLRVVAAHYEIVGVLLAACAPEGFDAPPDDTPAPSAPVPTMPAVPEPEVPFVYGRHRRAGQAKPDAGAQQAA